MLAVALSVPVAVAWAQSLPIPPIPPANRPPEQAAPMPNNNIRDPALTANTEVTLRPEFYRATRPDTSYGFTPGSRFQTNDEKRPLQTPGFRLTVPLQ